MAKLAGTTPQEFEGQLATTYLYADPKAAVAATSSPALITTMTRVRNFSFANGLFGRQRDRDAAAEGKAPHDDAVRAVSRRGEGVGCGGIP